MVGKYETDQDVNYAECKAGLIINDFSIDFNFTDKFSKAVVLMELLRALFCGVFGS